MDSDSLTYKNLIQDIGNIIDTSIPTYTNLGNVSALIKSRFNWFWVGFYKVERTELILNAFQGPAACVRIPKGKGVCGKAWSENKSIIVEDVDLFEGHISCNAASKSEIVIPFKNSNDEIVYVLDIDHDQKNAFNKIDEINLKTINKLIVPIL